MQEHEKALVILEELDKLIQVDWNFKDVYLEGIINGFREIERVSGEKI
ncbi:hypothetical protein ACYSNR_02095 [Enterococcus sp. LJL128]